VEFAPSRSRGCEERQQATDYCNYVFSKRQQRVHDLLRYFQGRAGSQVRDYEGVGLRKPSLSGIEEYSGLDDQTLQILMQEPEADTQIVVSYPDDFAQPQISVDPATGQPVQMPQPDAARCAGQAHHQGEPHSMWLACHLKSCCCLVRLCPSRTPHSSVIARWLMCWELIEMGYESR